MVQAWVQYNKWIKKYAKNTYIQKAYYVIGRERQAKNCVSYNEFYA